MRVGTDKAYTILMQANNLTVQINGVTSVLSYADASDRSLALTLIRMVRIFDMPSDAATEFYLTGTALTDTGIEIARTL